MVNWNTQGYDALKPVAQGNAYANQIFDMAAQRDAGKRYASGDTAGASRALAQNGDIKGAMAIDDRQRGIANEGQDRAIASAKASHEFLKQAVPMLVAIHQKAGPQGLMEAWASTIAPELKSYGAADATIAQLAQAFQANPQGTLQALGGIAQRKLVFRQVGNDVVAFDEGTGEEVSRSKAGPSQSDLARDANNPFKADGSPNAQYQQYERSKVAADAAARRAPAADKPRIRLMTTEEKTAAGLPAESAYQIGDNGQITRVAGNTSVRPIPSSALTGIQNNRRTLTKIDSAIAALEKNPNAIGLKTYAGDAITQRTDPGGVSVRALVADVGSQKLHDRSGAAVTLSESPRLQPFIPSVHDTADAAVVKLKNLKAEYEASTDEAEAFYSPEAGYMSLPPRGATTAQGGGGQKPQSAQQPRVIDFSELPP